MFNWPDDTFSGTSRAGSGKDADRPTDFFERMRALGSELTQEQKDLIYRRSSAVFDYKPKVGVFGKTGAGKSSLCNALFGKETAKVSDVSAGTRVPQEILLSLSKNGNGIMLMDVPGVGESRERDEEYKALYRQLLPDLDLVLWVLKGDDRAMSIDEHFYHEVVQPELAKTSAKIIFVINQVDIIQPRREWDFVTHRPSSNQMLNIELKRVDVASAFGVPLSEVGTVAADENYNLVDLVDRMISALPKEKKWGLLRETKLDARSAKATEESRSGLWETVKEIVIEVATRAFPAVIAAAFDFIRKWW